MITASPQIVDVPDHHLRAIDALKRNTTFLWKSLAAAEVDKKTFICPMRQSTYDRIRQDLATLSEAGFFQFNIVYGGTAGRDGSVLRLELSEISDSFWEIIQTFYHEPESPRSDATPAEPERPAASDHPVVASRARLPSTRPLTRAAVPGSLDLRRPATWFSTGFSGLALLGLTLLLAVLFWFDRLPSPAWFEARFAPVTGLRPVGTGEVDLQPDALSRSPALQDARTPAGAPVKSLYTPNSLQSDLLRLSPEEEEPASGTGGAVTMAATVVVDVPQLNMHAEPSFHGLLLRQLRQGDVLRVLQQSNGWLQVTDPANNPGWVLAYATRDTVTRKRLTLLDSIANGR
ncbi:MAG: hypothetical protein HQM02_04850 [Magnetococcales bacterium]|nr:hypothetical protein [Magnetococcales bacterium]